MKDLDRLYFVSQDVAAALDSDEPEAAERVLALVPKIESAVEQVARWIELEGDGVELLKAREAAIRDERKAREERIERARTHLLNAMQRAEIMRIVDSRTGTSIALKKNPPQVVVDDPEKIPKAFWREIPAPPPAIDKRELAKALKEYEVPGAHSEQTWKVEIRG